MLFKKLIIKLLNLAQRLNDWCYLHDDGSQFDKILDVQLQINELRAEHNLFDDDKFLQ